METLLGVVVGIIVLIVLVCLHELGHAITGYRNGVVVEEYGIGFPPKAWAKKLKNGILFSINWLPLGGFVRMQGEHDSASKEGDYGAASYWVKTKILLSGVVVNWVVAAIIFTVLSIFGLPKIIPNQFTFSPDTRTEVQQNAEFPVLEVEKGSVADKAGIKKGDKILALNGKKVNQSGQVQDFTSSHYGDKVNIKVKRDNSQKDFTVTLPKEPSKQGYIFGVQSGYVPEKATIHATWSAPIVGIGTTAQLSWATIKGIGKIFVSLWQSLEGKFSDNPATELQGEHAQSFVSNSVAGPIGIVGWIFPMIVRGGVVSIMMFTAIISLTLAVMNILPIHALDGGRWYTMTIFRIIRKKLTKQREENIQAFSMMAILALFVLISVADVGKLIG